MIEGARGDCNSLGLNVTRDGEAWDEGIGRLSTSGARFRRARPVLAVTGSALLVRRAAFEALGGWDELYGWYYEDVDLCLRARAAGWERRRGPGRDRAPRPLGDGAARLGAQALPHVPQPSPPRRRPLAARPAARRRPAPPPERVLAPGRARRGGESARGALAGPGLARLPAPAARGARPAAPTRPAAGLGRAPAPGRARSRARAHEPDPRRRRLPAPLREHAPELRPRHPHLAVRLEPGPGRPRGAACSR